MLPQTSDRSDYGAAKDRQAHDIATGSVQQSTQLRLFTGLAYKPQRDFRDRQLEGSQQQVRQGEEELALLPEQSRQKVLILTTQARSFLRFRGELLESAVNLGHDVKVMSYVGNREPGPFEKRISELGGEWGELPIRPAGMNPVKDTIGFARLVAQISRAKPDSLILFGMKPIALGSLAGRAAGVENIVSTVAGLGFAFASNSLKGRAARFALSNQLRPGLAKNSRVIFQNQDDLDTFCELGLVKRDRCALVNGSGVDLDYYSPQPAQTDEFRFLLSARLIHSKGIREFAKAAELVKRFYPEVKFQLMGEFSDNPDGIRPEKVQEWVDSGLIEYLGFHDDVRPHLRDASVVVLPSNYREGVPVALLESLAMGKPLITSDAPGCRDTVIHRENGLLIDPKDAATLAQAMLYMVAHRDSLNDMGTSSRQLAESYWSRPLVTRQMLEFTGLHSQPQQG